jgi:hypothetical protein
MARMPMPMLMGGERDPELTSLVRDIVALRAIDSLGMTRDQIEKLIPLLEQELAAEGRLRDQALEQLRGERARLIAGTATPERSRAAQAAIAEARRRYAQDMERMTSQAGSFLSAQQVEKLKRLAAGALTSARGRLGAGAVPRAEEGARRGAAKAPQERKGELGGVLQGLGRGPSAQVLTHVIGLLKEKLEAMEVGSR